jgi:hypothetical protein
LAIRSETPIWRGGNGGMAVAATASLLSMMMLGIAALAAGMVVMAQLAGVGMTRVEPKCRRVAVNAGIGQRAPQIAGVATQHIERRRAIGGHRRMQVPLVIEGKPHIDAAHFGWVQSDQHLLLAVGHLPRNLHAKFAPDSARLGRDYWLRG